MQTCTLYIVRHGESVSNRDNIVGGHFDSPLTDLGRQQAEHTREALMHVTFDAVYSSDLQRAYETAGIIYGSPVPQGHRLKALRERHYTTFENGPGEIFDEHLNGFLERYQAMTREERWQFTYDNTMESYAQVEARLFDSLRQICAEHSGQAVLIGAHGGVIRVLLAALNFAPIDHMPMGTFDNAGYVHLKVQNDTLKIVEVKGITPLDKPAIVY